MVDRCNLADLAERALALARRRNLTIVTAESCTAGKLSALLSEAPGASEHLHGSFVTYTKANNVKSLGVDAGLLKAKGAVCREVAVAMAEGALHRSPADVAVAITGVAGPDADEDGNPVGLVCIAVTRDGCQPLHVERKYGDLGREKVQEHAMANALVELIRCLEANWIQGPDAWNGCAGQYPTTRRRVDRIIQSIMLGDRGRRVEPPARLGVFRSMAIEFHFTPELHLKDGRIIRDLDDALGFAREQEARPGVDQRDEILHKIEHAQSKEEAHAAAHSFVRWLEQLEILE